jgi:hypothetical protein
MSAGTTTESRLWEPANYRAFISLCESAIKLPELQHITSGLLAAPPPPFADLSSASSAIRNHPIYRELQRLVPAAMEYPVRTGIAGTIAECKFLHFLAQAMVACWRLATDTPNIKGKRENSTRTDHEREKDLRVLNRLIDRLDSIKARFESEEDAKQFEHLVATALQDLGCRVWDTTGAQLPGKRLPGGPRNSERIMLRFIARKLEREFGSADPMVLLDVAAATGVELSERDAQRYCASVRK